MGTTTIAMMVGRVWLLGLMVVLTFIPPCYGNLNLYLTNAEVRRILGLPAELYYVREGVVNEYAMGWEVPVPADVHALHFTWVATDNKPLLYNLAVWTKEAADKGESLDTKLNERLDKRKPTRKKTAGTTNKPEKKGPLVLATPYVNISLTGTVPTEPTTFTLHLPCTGAVSAEVAVTLNINVTSPGPNLPPTELYFKRKKICLEGQTSEAFAPHQDPLEESDPLSRPSLFYALCGAGAVIIVVTSMFCAAFFRRRVKANRHRDHCTLTSNCDQKSRVGTTSSLLSPTSNNVYTPTNHTYTPSTHTYTLPSSTTSNCYASLTQLPITPSQAAPRQPPIQTLPRPPSSRPPNTATSTSSSAKQPNGTKGFAASLGLIPGLGSTLPSRDCTLTTASGAGSRDSTLNRRELLVDPCTAQLEENFKHLQVDRRRVKLTCVLIEGRYGRLYKGCIQADAPLPDTQVLVKTVQCSATQQHIRLLCRDAVRLAAVQHRAVLSLAAVSAGASSPPLFIFPDLGFHNLKLFLRGRATHLTPGDLQLVSLQAAQGLAFLHSCNILHTDLAARNCVINDQLQLRLTDTALASDLFPDDYQNMNGASDSSARPIAWMALEAISDGVVAQPSDVWSWGVLAWELSTLAQQPYQDIVLTRLPDYLRDGYRLSQPPTCPDVLYQLMAFCWAINPQHRPRAALLVEYLLGLNQQPFSTFSNTLPPTISAAESANHIPPSSFLHNSASVGADLKRLNQSSSLLMNTSASVGGDIKGLTHQFHSHLAFSSSSVCSSKPELKSFAQLAPVYSKPASVLGGANSEDAINDASSLGVFTSGVYSTPSSSNTMPPGDLDWRLPQSSSSSLRPPNGAISVPPPLPPANGTAGVSKAPRPQQPLPNASNTIIL